MKTIKNTLLVAIISSIGLQLYLSLHYYQLHSAKGASSSMCNINKVFNCDAVSASSFSNIAGIPISNIGLSLHLILLALLVLSSINVAGSISVASSKRLQSAFTLATFSLLGSIAMAGISLLFLNVYCIFCIALYILSILIWCLLKKLNPEFKFNLKTFSNTNLILKPLIAIFILSFLSHILLSDSSSTKESSKQISFITEEWASNPEINLTQTPMLSLGASKENAQITIVEFADYLCSHCKNAEPQIKAFVTANLKNTRLEFYPFPLDSQCNPAMKFSRGGLSCTLTTAVFCAEKQNKGWPIHKFIFKNQEQFHKNYDPSQFFADIKNTTPQLNFKQWEDCFNDDKTKEEIFIFSQAGQTAQVQGTPSFLVNKRKLEKAQFLPVLNAVKYKILQNLQ